MYHIRFALLLFPLLFATSVSAQDEPIILETPERESLDLRLFRAVYEEDNPVFTGVMQGVNAASYPTFYLVIPAAGAVDFAADGTIGAASRAAISELATFGVVYGLKSLIRRARPYVALSGIQRRPPDEDQIPGGVDPFSFPSGHSSVAFSIATSMSLSFPEWYVIAPSMTWASATALARVWHGMHFPSDIVVGAIVGAGSALLVHVLVAPSEDEPINEETLLSMPSAFSLTIPF